MASQIDVVCSTINDQFLNQEFQIPDLINSLDSNISFNAVQQTIHYARLNGFITTDRPGAIGRARKTYKVILPLECERVKRSQQIAHNKAKGLIAPDRFTDENHPAKRHITDHFYTAFSVYSPRTESILALCGPNVERFIRNSMKITDMSAPPKVSLVECEEGVAEEIMGKLSMYGKKQPLPTYNMYNVRLEDFLGSGFYQFQELDCEGNWKLLYPTYHKRLIEQAENQSHIKGMVITTFARVQGIPILNEYLSLLLSNIGTSFTNNEIMESSAVKKMLGQWRYVHLYDSFPKCINMGRLLKLLIYRYSQGGCQMFSALMIYR